MKKLILSTIKHPLISGSAIIVIGTNLGNIFHLLFNIFMVRNLSIPDYGILVSLLSLVTLFGIAASSLTPAIVQFAASFFAKQEMNKVYSLFMKLTKVFLVVGVIQLLFFTLFVQDVSHFLKISSNPIFIIITSITILLSLMLVVNNSFLQAKLSFGFLSIINFLSGFLKFLTGIIFIYIGQQVFGVLIGIFITIGVVYIISFFPLKKIFIKHKETHSTPLKSLITYGGPSAIALLSLNAFVYTDVILVKHFFDPYQAGLYGGLSTMGKMIFFLSYPVSLVMFPLIVQRKTQGKDYNKIFWASLGLVLIPSIFFMILFYFFPSFIISTIFQPGYLAIGNILWMFGLLITIYSLLFVMTNFFLSIKKTNIAIPLLIFSIIQALLIWNFHNSFQEIILISLIIMSVLFFGFVIYYLTLYGKEKR